MDRQIIDYLPPVLQAIKEISALMNAEQPEAEMLWDASDSLLYERLVNTATEYGISRWEAILHIHPRITETLEMRRQRIKGKIYFSIPYTLIWLRGWLEQQFGAGNTSVYLKDYTVYPAIDPGDGMSTAVLASVEEMLNEVKPENIIVAMAFRLLHGLSIGKSYISYLSDCPMCGALYCGVYPGTACVGYEDSAAFSLGVVRNYYSVTATACGTAYCNSH